MQFFAYNFSVVWPKITKLVSLDSAHHVESNHIQFSHVSHFEFCSQMLYFTKALMQVFELPELAHSIWWRIVELHFVHLGCFPNRQPMLINRLLTSKIRMFFFFFSGL